jgi:hypothetical protein
MKPFQRPSYFQTFEFNIESFMKFLGEFLVQNWRGNIIGRNREGHI